MSAMIQIGQIQLFLLALTRILMVLSRVPMLGGEMIPSQVRIGLGVILAVTLAPWEMLPGPVETLDPMIFGINVGRELLIGALIGFIVGLAFEAVQIAGEVMGLESGFSAGQIFNPILGEGSQAFVQLFNLSATLLFLVIDGHSQLILALSRTFEILPLKAPLPLDSLETAISQTSRLITAGVQIGLPVMSALFLADLTLGLLARVAPQVQVFFLGLPVKVALAFFSLGVVFTALIPALENIFGDVGPRILALLE